MFLNLCLFFGPGLGKPFVDQICIVIYSIRYFYLSSYVVNWYHKVGANKLQIVPGTDIASSCPWSTVIFECTVTGSGGTITVWKGTAFHHDCNEIALLHSRFVETVSGQCNNGAITAQSLRIVNNSYSKDYVSQLKVIVTPEMIEKSIECFNDNGTASLSVGSVKLDVSISVTCINATTSANLNASTVTLKGNNRLSSIYNY